MHLPQRASILARSLALRRESHLPRDFLRVDRSFLVDSDVHRTFLRPCSAWMLLPQHQGQVAPVYKLSSVALSLGSCSRSHLPQYSSTVVPSLVSNVGRTCREVRKVSVSPSLLLLTRIAAASDHDLGRAFLSILRRSHLAVDSFRIALSQ